MHESTAVVIRGDAQAIYEYAARVERWPAILPHYRGIEIVAGAGRERTVAMHCVRSFGVLRWPCRWTARQFLRPELGEIEYVHLTGPARGMTVLWRIEPVADGARTMIEHRAAEGGIWRDFYFSRLVGPLFVRNVATKTLTVIKSIVERESKL